VPITVELVCLVVIAVCAVVLTAHFVF